jgi:hypothetical protein
VGIGTIAPDASAVLDIVSTSKGALLPRVALANGIANPATGLLVFQTGGTPGFYYNAGTAAAPNWQQIATAAGAAVTASNGLAKTGQNIALGGPLTQATTIAQAGFALGFTGGNVGVGTSAPTQRLDVAGNVQVPAANAYRYATPKSYSLSVAAADFQPETFATTKELFDQGNSDLFYANNAGGALRAPLHLPQGATITGFVVRYADNSATADLTVTLRNRSNVATTTLATFTSAGASGNFQTSTTPLTAVVNNNNSSYYLRATFGAVFQQLSIVSVEVTYTVTQAE